jgi:hypothetical protein
MPDWKPHIRPHLAVLRLSPARESEIVEELSQHLDDRWREIATVANPGDRRSVRTSQRRSAPRSSSHRRRCSSRWASMVASGAPTCFLDRHAGTDVFVR